LWQYGNLSVPAIVAITKRTEPFKVAKQYRLLEMNQSAPAEQTTEGDWDFYQRELKELGTVSLEELQQRYGLT
jgi:hypothetical protein